MSEDRVSVVRLDAPMGEVLRLADRGIEWMLDRELTQANVRQDSLWQPSAWMPGPRWRDAVQEGPGSDHFLESANNGVDVAVTRAFYHPVENYEPPSCGHCGASLSSDAHHECVEPWMAGHEPVVSCAACGWSSLIGDWPPRWGFAVGAPAVVMNNWPILREEFLASQRSVLGGRAFVILSHH
jgi:hypothetical protein